MFDMYDSINDKKSYNEFINHYRKDIIKLIDLGNHINTSMNREEISLNNIKSGLSALNSIVVKYKTLQDLSNDKLAKLIYEKEKDNILKIYALIERYYYSSLFPEIKKHIANERIKDVVISIEEFDKLSHLLYDYGILEIEEYDDRTYELTAIGYKFYRYILPIIYPKTHY